MPKDELRVVLGPLAPAAGSGIVYSIRLTSGFIATSPASFGDTTDDQSHPVPVPPTNPALPAPSI